MTRELKLALIVGFSVMLLVTVLISDHLSRGRKAQSQAKLPEQPPVVIAQEAPRQPDPLVTITQGSLGGISEAPLDGTFAQGGLGGAQPGQSVTDELARRAGQVITGDAAMPAQLETTPLPLGQNLVPSLGNQNFTLPRTGGASVQMPESSSNAISDSMNPAMQPLLASPSEQTPTGSTLAGGGAGATSVVRDSLTRDSVVRDGELRLPAQPAGGAPSTPEQTPLPQAAAPKASDAKPTAEDRWHTVTSGDSAYSIAKKYYGNGEHWKALAKYNKDRIGANGNVRVGVRVRIPEASVLGIKTAKVDAKAVERNLVAKQPAKAESKTESKTESKSESKPTSKPDASADKPATAKASTYTVKAGDSLARIAQQQLGSTKRMQDILKLNPSIKDADDIRAGMTLKMPTK